MKSKKLASIIANQIKFRIDTSKGLDVELYYNEITNYLGEHYYNYNIVDSIKNPFMINRSDNFQYVSDNNNNVTILNKFF